MLEDIGNHNNNEISNNKKKTILLVTDNIQHYQQQFNNYNINNYKITFVNWNDVLTFITNRDGDAKRINLELVILEISTAAVVEYAKINKLPTITTTTIGEIKKIFYDKRIFFLIPSQSKIETILSMGICKQEDIRIQAFYLESQMASHDIDISKLQNDGLLKIAYSEDWYLSTNQKNNTNNKNTITIDHEKVYTKFFNFAEQVTKKEGKKGLRIFGMMDCFFEHGLVDEIVDYDCMMPPKFNKSILSICAYNDKHIAQLSEDQIRRLVLTHTSVWI